MSLQTHTQQLNELAELATPLVVWLLRRTPHTSIHITSAGVRVVEDRLFVPTDKVIGVAKERARLAAFSVNGYQYLGRVLQAYPETVIVMVESSSDPEVRVGLVTRFDRKNEVPL